MKDKYIVFSDSQNVHRYFTNKAKTIKEAQSLSEYYDEDFYVTEIIGKVYVNNHREIKYKTTHQ